MIARLAQLGFSLLCFISCYTAVLLHFTQYAQYDAHEKSYSSFCTKLAWLLYHKDSYIKSDDQNVYKLTDNDFY